MDRLLVPISRLKNQFFMIYRFTLVSDLQYNFLDLSDKGFPFPNCPQLTWFFFLVVFFETGKK